MAFTKKPTAWKRPTPESVPLESGRTIIPINFDDLTPEKQQLLLTAYKIDDPKQAGWQSRPLFTLHPTLGTHAEFVRQYKGGKPEDEIPEPKVPTIDIIPKADPEKLKEAQKERAKKRREATKDAKKAA